MNYLVIAIVALIIAGLSYLGYILLSNKEKLTDDTDDCWPPPGQSMPSADPPYRYLYVIPNSDGENTYTFTGTKNPRVSGAIQLDKSLTCTNNTKCASWNGALDCLNNGGKVTGITPTGDTIEITQSML